MRIPRFLSPSKVIGRQVKLCRTHPWAGEIGIVRKYYPGIHSYIVDLYCGITCGVSHPDEVNFCFIKKKKDENIEIVLAEV